jgi:hypothetical protein
MLATLAGAFLGRLPLNPVDTGFALDWGRELARGALPGVHVAGAPTPHPLSIIEGSVASLAGPHALDVMQAIILVATGALAVMLWQVGKAARLPVAGLVGAGILLSDPCFLLTGVGRASPDDIPALAAVMTALALELRQPQRGWTPLALLLIAGLWRPETWLLSFAYATYCGRGRAIATRLRLAALAFVAPAAWLLCDLALTGNPLYSFVYTRWATAVSERPTGVAMVPTVLWHALTSYYAITTLVCAGLGVIADLRYRLMPRIVIIWAGVTVGTFAVVGALSLPVIDRYALPVMVATALYAGVFISGWRRLERGALRRWWSVASIAACAVIASATVGGLSGIRERQRSIAELARMDRNLADIAADPDVRSSRLSCGAVQTSYQVVPLLAFDLDRSTEGLIRVNEGLPGSGVFIEPAHAQSLFEAQLIPPRVLSENGFTTIVRNSDWLAVRRCRHGVGRR